MKKDKVSQKTTIFAGNYEAITENGKKRELFYISGADGLAAIYVKQAGQTDKIYYPHFDHLGSVVKITDNNATEVFKASYDVWGKRTVSRNTFAWHRGFTGHEHLDEFRLIDMNGRMYDPILGRFLSADPFVQAPDLSQNYNRYSYCINNPLLYTDPSGEYFLIDDLFAAVIGGATNVVVNAFQGNIHSWEQGFSYFGVGAAGTVAGMYGGPIAAGAIFGAGNSFVTQGFGSNGNWNWNNLSGQQMLFDGIMGGITGQIASSLGGVISPHVSKLTSGIGGEAVQQGLAQGITGSATGFTLNTGLALVGGENLDDALKAGGQGALMGFGIGATTGMISGVKAARDAGESPWTGQPRNITSNHAQQRATERNVSQNDINDTLKNPLKVTEVKNQENGPSVKYIGPKVTVVVNPETGNIITVYRTSTQRVNSLLKLKNDEN